MNRFQIRAQANVVDIVIYDVIGEDWFGGVSAKSVIDVLLANEKKPVNLYLNSAGGDVFQAEAIYNALKRHDADVTVYVDGSALSSASLIAMAGDDIVIASNAMMMIHEPWAYFVGTADEMRTEADLLDKINETLIQTYAERSGQERERIAELMKATTWFNADEAVAAGLADRIAEAKKVAACATERLPAALQDRIRSRLPQSAADEGDTEMADDKIEAPKVATMAELKAAFPKADDAFFVACALDSVTIEQAKDRWVKAVEAKLDEQRVQTDEIKAERDKLAEAAKAKESKAASFSGSEQPKGFMALAADLAKEEGISLRDAQSRIARENPDLYDEYRETFRGAPKKFRRGE